MPTYGIMHDDGTFEPLQQGGQNYGSRPMNLPPGVYWDAQRGVYTNTTPVSSVPGGRVQRYSGNGYAPRRMNLPQGIYWDAQRGVYTNTTPVSSVPGGRVQRGNIPFNITQTAKRPVNNPYVPNVSNYTNYMQNMRDAVDWSYSNVPNITQQGRRPANVPVYNPDMSNYTNYMQNMRDAVDWSYSNVPNITQQGRRPANVPVYNPDMSNYTNYMQNMRDAVDWSYSNVPNITQQGRRPANVPVYNPDMSNYANYMQNMNNAVNWAGGVNSVPQNITQQAKFPPDTSSDTILSAIRQWFSERGNMTQEDINGRMTQLQSVIGDVDVSTTSTTPLSLTDVAKRALTEEEKRLQAAKDALSASPTANTDEALEEMQRKLGLR